MEKNLKKFVEEMHLKNILEWYESDFEELVSEGNQWLFDYIACSDTLDQFVLRAEETRDYLYMNGDGLNEDFMDLDHISPIHVYAERIVDEYGRFENEDLYGCIIVR